MSFGGGYSFIYKKRGGSLKKYLDEGQNASDYYTYYNEPFSAALASNNGDNNFTALRESWYEQRDYGLHFALQALSYSTYAADLKLYEAIIQEWDGRLHNVSIPNLDGWMLINDTSEVFKLCDNRFQLGFNQSTGAINILEDIINGIQYTQPNSDYQFGQFWYQTLNQTLKECPGHITLPHYYISSQLLNIYRSIEDESMFLLEMNMGDKEMYDMLYANYSAIQWIYNYIEFDCENNVIEMNVDFINKSFTRVTENMYFSFNPVNCSNWTISSIEEDMMLNDVVEGGTQNVYSYGANGNISCLMNNADGYDVSFASKDIGLVSFKPIEYPFDYIVNEYSYDEGFHVDSSPNGGFAFYLMNNLWDTNYPQWYPFAKEDTNMTYNMRIFL